MEKYVLDVSMRFQRNYKVNNVIVLNFLEVESDYYWVELEKLIMRKN